jgi:hypothetical protein
LAIVDWLSEGTENQAVVVSGPRQLQIAGVRRPSQPPYLRARADGVWTDDLLSLASF